MSRHPRRAKARIRDCIRVPRAGTIASAATLAVFCEGYAEVIYVPAGYVIPAGGQQSCDVDGDGHDDVSFSSIIDPLGPGTFQAVMNVHAGPNAGCTGVLVRDSMYPSQVRAFSLGATIHFEGPDTQPGGDLATHDGMFPQGGFFDTEAPRYAGFTMFPGDGSCDNTHPAWARVNVTPDFDIEVLGFGYQASVHVEIYAGDGATPVPEGPGSDTWGRVKSQYRD